MTDSPIDHEIFKELVDTTGEDFAAELVETFLDEAPSMVDELKTAAGEADADRYRRAAHSIKSNASTFGATALAELARKVELGELPEAGDLTDVTALETALTTTTAALRSLIDA